MGCIRGMTIVALMSLLVFLGFLLTASPVDVEVNRRVLGALSLLALRRLIRSILVSSRASPLRKGILVFAVLGMVVLEATDVLSTDVSPGAHLVDGIS